MDMKKYVPAVVVTFILYSVLLYIIQQILVMSDYAALPGLLREEMMWPYVLVGEVIFSLAFVYIYSKGVEAKPWLGQAVCYGVLVWLLIGLSTSFLMYAFVPVAAMLVVQQAILWLIALVILAIPVAYIYRK